MSTPVESTFTFYGNEKIRELEKEIMKYIDERFLKIQERINIMKIPQGSFDVNE